MKKIIIIANILILTLGTAIAGLTIIVPVDTWCSSSVRELATGAPLINIEDVRITVTKEPSGGLKTTYLIETDPSTEKFIIRFFKPGTYELYFYHQDYKDVFVTYHADKEKMDEVLILGDIFMERYR